MSSTLPIKDTKIPSAFILETLLLKNNAPIIKTNTGVSEFREPTKELSILVSAMQNKNAGIKLPSKPDRNMVKILLLGMVLNLRIATGNNTIPEKIMRKLAS